MRTLLAAAAFAVAFAAGAQDKVLRGRREFLEAQLEYWRAVYELERALGARLADVEGREE